MVVVLIVLSSCVQTGDVLCSNGRVCPADFVCVAGGEACASADQLKACKGAEDASPCTSTAGPGTCFDGACIVAFCGNGEMEPGEICDDGNQFSGDGCNGSCTSDESCGNGIIELDEECDSTDTAKCDQTTCQIVRCGNGIVEAAEVCDDGNNDGGDGCSFDCVSLELCGNSTLDYYAGEQCEDHNTRNFDGCSASCDIELMAWTQFDSSTVPPLVSGPAVSYDVRRNRLVMFAGGNGNYMPRDTWELDGVSWEVRYPAAPPSRQNAMVAYDTKRGRIVLFGGLGQGYLDDTWEFDGIQWTKNTTATHPSARSNGAMAYDSARERVVLFGGVRTTPTVYYDETWEYDGTTWTQVATPTKPSQRSGTTMAYDPKRNRTVLWSGGFGPPPDFTSIPSDVWEYDGATWTQRTLAGPLPPAGGSRMTFDPTREAIVLLDGNDTWQLDSTGWLKIVTGSVDWTAAPIYFDPYRGRLVRTRAPGTNPVQSEELIGTTWTPIAVEIATQRYTAAAFDVRDGKAIMFSGESGAPGSTPLSTNDTWELTGRQWHEVTTTGTPPSTRYGHAMAYDAERGVVVLFGGAPAGVASNGTWEYNPVTHVWSQPTLSGSPPPARFEHAMAYDSTRKRVVMFGGRSAGVSYLNDTWEYDGASWTQQTTATTPPARGTHGMAFDSKRSRIVMFGGFGTPVPAADTWVYDGTNWSTLIATNPPPAIANFGMTYDAGRDRVVLHGGGGATSALNDTWELADSEWTLYSRAATQLPAPFASQPSLVYDPVRRRTILIGSFPPYDGSQSTPDDLLTAELAPVENTPAEACSLGFDFDRDTKAGCDDDDCWGTCAPLCLPDAPAASCPTKSRCGDSNCDGIESCRVCPGDCGACPVECGDGFCDAAESVASCPGDCA
jgi:cysteine-rich repeat protein